MAPRPPVNWIYGEQLDEDPVEDGTTTGVTNDRPTDDDAKRIALNASTMQLVTSGGAVVHATRATGTPPLPTATRTCTVPDTSESRVLAVLMHWRRRKRFHMTTSSGSLARASLSDGGTGGQPSVAPDSVLKTRGTVNCTGSRGTGRGNRIVRNTAATHVVSAGDALLQLACASTTRPSPSIETAIFALPRLE